MMQERFAELQQRLSVLEDLRAIKELKYRYLRACDRKLPDAVRDCLDPDGAVIAYEGFPRFESRDAFVEVFSHMACKPSIIDMHHGENPEIVLTGADSATGKWDLYFQSIDTEAGTIVQMGCEYTDRYTRKNGSWWITETTTRRTSFLMQQRQPDGTMQVLVMGQPPDAPYATPAPER